MDSRVVAIARGQPTSSRDLPCKPTSHPFVERQQLEIAKKNKNPDLAPYVLALQITRIEGRNAIAHAGEAHKGPRMPFAYFNVPVSSLSVSPTQLPRLKQAPAQIDAESRTPEYGLTKETLTSQK